MIIKSIRIEKFRAINNQFFPLGKQLTAIIGRNKTMKSTLLGIISQTFSISKDSPLNGIKTVDGYNFKSQFSEKFKFNENERVGDHKWELELEEGLHHINPFPVKSIEREKNNEKIRFWYEKGKHKGTGYVQVPVYFLSLSRLFPIGESKVKNSQQADVINDESFVQEFKIAYEKILSDNDITNISLVKDNNTVYSGINNSKYSYLTNSAGQSNITRIINAVLSFKKIQSTHNDIYKGGILLIDELDATLHPFAQKEIVKFLAKASSQYKIQIVFTTHSHHIIEAMQELVLNDRITINNNKVLFLKNKANKVTIEAISSIGGFRRIDSNLKIAKYKPMQIKVYCEDDVGRSLASKLVNIKIRQRLDFQKVHFGFEQYIKMLMQKFANLHDSIIIFDGDVEKLINESSRNQEDKQKIMRYIKKQKNLVLLPESDCPEIEFYDMIINMDDIKFEEIFGNEKECYIQGEFVKSKYDCLYNHKDKKEFCKKFYKTCDIKSKIINQWIQLNKDKKDIFLKNLAKSFDYLAKRLKIETIEEVS